MKPFIISERIVLRYSGTLASGIWNIVMYGCFLLVVFYLGHRTTKHHQYLINYD